MRKQKDLKRDVVDRCIVDFLHKMGIWIPEEILPKNLQTGEPLVHLKRRNDKLFASQQEFWKPVGFLSERIAYVNTGGVVTKKVLSVARSIWTDNADHNRGIIIDLLKNLNVWKLPLSVENSEGEWIAHGTETATGLAFGTYYYRNKQGLCMNFLQTLQDQKLCSEGTKNWYFARVAIAPGIHNFKIMVIKGWEWVDNTYHQKKEEA